MTAEPTPPPPPLSRRPRRRAGYKYDWDLLADGQPRKLVRGEHFACQVRTFKTAAYRAARSRRLPPPTIEVVDGGAAVILQFLRRPRGKVAQAVGEQKAVTVEIEQGQTVRITIKSQ